MQKALLLVIDSLRNRSIKKLEGLPLLEADCTPNLNAMATRGVCGVMNTLGIGTYPGSDISHLAILDYDIEQYYTGRGTIEVAGLGMELEESDVALQDNLGRLLTISWSPTAGPTESAIPAPSSRS